MTQTQPYRYLSPSRSIAMYLQNWLPLYCDWFTTSFPISSVSVDGSYNVTIHSSIPFFAEQFPDPLTESTTNVNPEINNAIITTGINYLYPIANLTRPFPNNQVLKNRVIATTVTDQLLGSDTQQIKILGVTADTTFNGTYPVIESGLNSSFSYEIDLNLTPASTSINNEGFYAMQYYDNVLFGATQYDIFKSETMNGYKKVTNIIDSQTIQFAINPANIKYDLTSTFDISNAFVKIAPRITDTINVERAIAMYKEINYQNSWLFVIGEGSELGINNISTSAFGIANNANQDVAQQIENIITLVFCTPIAQDYTLADLREQEFNLTTILNQLLTYATMPSPYSENYYQYVGTPISSGVVEEVHGNFGIITYKYKMNTVMRNIDITNTKPFIPITSFNLPNLNQNNSIIANGNLT